MHTAGEPVRIITGGYPELEGDTLLEKRRDAHENHDHLRKALMLEPRGHAEMYGALVLPPCHKDADLSVLFMHNSGYSTMCGHATIALGRWAVESGRIEAREGTTDFTLECPCGLVDVSASVEGGKVTHVRFHNVPGYVAAEDVAVELEGIGRIRADIAFGGAYYAIVPAHRLGLDLHTSPLEDLKARALEITDNLRANHTLTHPFEEDLGFLYGTILTEGAVINRGEINHHLCFFGDGQLDRSPTGSGVSARLALAHAKEEIAQGQRCCFKGVSGVSFGGVITERTRFGNHKAVIARVSGQGYYTAETRFLIEADDPLAEGFTPPQCPADLWQHR
ncbi:MAG: proline racemase family protein [Alphaproteobacteria bacterium]|nr:proline racemase family protein [Alphaproteobacteria bacterium]